MNESMDRLMDGWMEKRVLRMVPIFLNKNQKRFFFRKIIQQEETAK